MRKKDQFHYLLFTFCELFFSSAATLLHGIWRLVLTYFKELKTIFGQFQIFLYNFPTCQLLLVTQNFHISRLNL